MAQPWKTNEHAVIATDTVIFTIINRELNVLLIKTTDGPFPDKWALPGGLVGVMETIDNASRRHLRDKTGIDDIYLEQLYTFGDIDRDPWGRVVSVAYFALISNGGDLKLKTSERYSAIEWVPISKIEKLAYDHNEIIKMASERLKAKLEYTNIVFGLLPNKFSLGELQEVYEMILEKKMDKRNFRKRVMALKIIRKTGKKKMGEANRPADLYEFIERKIKIVEMI